MQTCGQWSDVFPACAGVSLFIGILIQTKKRFPRVCGGEPRVLWFRSNIIVFSPRVRG